MGYKPCLRNRQQKFNKPARVKSMFVRGDRGSNFVLSSGTYRQNHTTTRGKSCRLRLLNTTLLKLGLHYWSTQTLHYWRNMLHGFWFIA